MTLLGFRGVSPLVMLLYPLALAVVFGGFWILWRRAEQISGRVRWGFLGTWSLLTLSTIGVYPFVKGHHKFLIVYWTLVLACYTATAAGIFLAAYLSPGPASCPHAASRRRFLAGGVMAAAGSLVSIAGVHAATDSGRDVIERRLEVKRAPGSAPGRELRVSFFSDLHAGFFLPRGYLTQAAGIMSAFKPDVILFGGDLVEYELSALDEVKGFFQGLTGLAPVYAVLGNHDGYLDFDAVAAFHRLSGVTPLRGESAVLAGPWGRFNLVGLHDVTERGWSWRPLERHDPAGTILLSHNPMSVLNIPESHTPLVALSGHTHGGQLRLPLAGAMVNQADRRIAAGMNRIDGKRIIVSAGVGYSGLPLRMLCPPDVTNIVIS